MQCRHPTKTVTKLCSPKDSITISKEKNIKFQKGSQEHVPILIQGIVTLQERKMAVAIYILQNLAKSKNAEKKEVHCDIQKHVYMVNSTDTRQDACKIMQRTMPVNQEVIPR